MKQRNHMYVKLDAKSVNEGVARMTVAAFMMEMNPTLDQLQDVKTAVSEAVTNAIIHGYDVDNEECFREEKQVEIICISEGQKLTVSIIDYGVGISNIEEARQPFYTTKPDKERSGMGFAFMEAFMDEIFVESEVGEGTKVTMIKYIERESER